MYLNRTREAMCELEVLHHYSSQFDLTAEVVGAGRRVKW